MKNSTTIILVSFAFLAALVTNSMAAGIFYWGSRSPGDVLLFQTEAVRQAHFLVTVVADIVFPPKGEQNKRIITQIVTVDKLAEYGGEPVLVGGGPGYTSATLKIKSIRNRAIYFTVKIYGH